MLSPYTPGAGRQPPLLAGRDGARAQVEELLTRTASFGRPGRPSVVFTGARGIGKTVLLCDLVSQAAEEGFLCLQVVVDRYRPLTSLLADALQRASSSPRPQEPPDPADASFQTDRTVGPGTTPSSQHRGPQEPTQRALLEQLATHARRARHDGPGLLLAIDELQDAAAADLATLDAITLELTDHPLVLIGAGLPQTPERLTRSGTAPDRIAFHPLTPLTESQATVALLHPALRAQVRWGQAAAEHVLTAAAGSPYLLQLYGDATWRTADPYPGDHIPAAAAHRGVVDGGQQLHDGMFRTRWNRASPGEQQYLTVMASQLAPDGTVTTGQVAAALGRPVTSVSYIRGRLLAKGLIQPAGHGRIAFTTPGFETYVAAQTGEHHR